MQCFFIKAYIPFSFYSDLIYVQSDNALFAVSRDTNLQAKTRRDHDVARFSSRQAVTA